MSTFIKDREVIEAWLSSNGISMYIINLDYTVDVYEDVNLAGLSLERLPVCFNDVRGDFRVGMNRLTTLEGSPRICRGFYCQSNQLTDLRGAPEIVDGTFQASVNRLTSLRGIPQEISGILNVRQNNLKSIDFLPDFRLDKGLLCEINPLVELPEQNPAWEVFGAPAANLVEQNRTTYCHHVLRNMVPKGLVVKERAL